MLKEIATPLSGARNINSDQREHQGSFRAMTPLGAIFTATLTATVREHQESFRAMTQAEQTTMNENLTPVIARS